MKVDAERLFVSLPIALAQSPPPVLVRTDDGEGTIPAEQGQALRAHLPPWRCPYHIVMFVNDSDNFICWAHDCSCTLG